MASAHACAGTRRDTGSWKIQISSTGECFKANDSSESGFSIRAARRLCKVKTPF